MPVLGTVSLYLTPRHRRKRRLQLASFLTVAVLLVAVSGGVVVFREAGAVVVGTLVSDLLRL